MSCLAVGGVCIPGRVVMAPMAGLTDGPFRIIAAALGCPAMWTEMIPAEGLVRRIPNTLAMLPAPGEPKPVAVQLFGHDADAIAGAAEVAAQAGASWIDLNMACPVSRLTGVGAGAALMLDPSGAARMVGEVRKRVAIPVTIKIRSGWDQRNMTALAVARAAVDAGAAAVTCHGRTRSQGFRGTADHSSAAKLAALLAVPVIISGDISSTEGAASVLRETGAAAVMVGRAAVGDPWIFSRIAIGLEGGERPAPSPGERLEIILRHFQLLLAAYGERRGMLLFRSHLTGYSRGRAGAAAFRQEAFRSTHPQELEDLIREFLTD